MAIREIRIQKDEILYKKTKTIDIIDDKIKLLASDMIDTLYKYDGMGLAANQVGVLKKMLVYDVDYIEENGKKNPQVILNPVIVKSSKQMVTSEEGCLSFPDLYGYVDRHETIVVEALNLEGQKITIHAKDKEAIVLQHEIDHLEGRVFVDIAYDTYVGQRPESRKEEKNKRKKGRN